MPKPAATPVDHRDRRLADVRNVAHQLGQAVEEALPGRIQSTGLIGRVAEVVVFGLELAEIGAAYIDAGAEAASDSREHDHLHIGVIIGCPHVLADFGQGAGPLGATDGGVQLLGPVEPDPQDPTVLFLVEEVRDKFEFLHLTASLDLGILILLGVAEPSSAFEDELR